MPGENDPSQHSRDHAPGRRGFFTTVLGAAAVGAAPTAAAEDAKGGRTVVNPRLFSFVGGAAGGWTVLSATAVTGDGLPAVERVAVVEGAATAEGAKWVLRGVTSNARYTTAGEKEVLLRKQTALGRPAATRAALIPIRKSARWWELTQDERRAIFEERSKHTTVGLKYLPAVARRLHHCRDLGEAEPFDFLTFFDFAPADEPAFDDMVAAMRASEEWKYVEREIDIRLERPR